MIFGANAKPSTLTVGISINRHDPIALCQGPYWDAHHEVRVRKCVELWEETGVGNTARKDEGPVNVLCMRSWLIEGLLRF